MRGWQIAVVLLGGCVVNGKAYGPGSSSTSSNGGAASNGGGAASSGGGANGGGANGGGGGSTAGYPTPNDDLHTPDGRVREDARYYKEPPYLAEPADPWAAVKGDQPLRWKQADADHWTIRANEEQCTAKRDHCLVKDTWFIVQQSDIDRGWGTAEAAPAVFGEDDRPAKPWNARSNARGGDYIAYRTVPATKANLVPGATVIGISQLNTIPTSGLSAIEMGWVRGIVESVDLETGTYRIKKRDQMYGITGARVAVLSWKPNSKVQIMDGKKRDELAVKASDVFLPDN